MTKTLSCHTIEVFAALFTISTVWLQAKEKIVAWPIGIVSLCLEFFIYYSAALYTQCILSIVYFFLSIFGWYNWLYKKRTKGKLQVTQLKLSTLFLLCFSGLIVGFAYHIILAQYINTSFPYLEAFHISFAIIAEWLISKKKLEGWILWIILDAMYIGICYLKELYIFSLIHILYVILAIYAYISWKKSFSNLRLLCYKN